MKKQNPLNLRSFGLTLLFCLSLGSFLYINNIDVKTCLKNKTINTIYADDMQESEEILPDLHIMKKMMHKAMEFII